MKNLFDFMAIIMIALVVTAGCFRVLSTFELSGEWYMFALSSNNLIKVLSSVFMIGFGVYGIKGIIRSAG